MTHPTLLLALLGSASCLAYAAALGLGDLRAHTAGFAMAFFCAFALYLAAAAIALRVRAGSRAGLWVIAAFAIAFRLILLPSRPTLSDDMYRYVWDGRVQAHGLSPYRYPPAAREVAGLRRGDREVWPFINRKPVVTVYPPGAQLAFAGLWRVVGDSVVGFKTALVAAELLGGALLVGLLRRFGLPPERALLYLWSPLLVFEVAHAGHVDGLMLPLLVAAFQARVAGRPGWLGFWLGAAALVKLFPALLFPALLPARGADEPRTGRLSWLRTGPLPVVLAFGATLGAGYLLYARGGASPLGFLFGYFGENFNLGLARLLFAASPWLGLERSTLANVVTFGGLAALGAWFVLRPAGTARQALGRCLWLIGWFTLFTQNLFAWYLLWLLPLIALFAEPGRRFGFRLAPVTGWLVFTGTSALSYLFFIQWRVVAWGQLAEYLPLYVVLAASAIAWRRRPAWWGAALKTPARSAAGPRPG
jgi:hypothetical protein